MVCVHFLTDGGQLGLLVIISSDLWPINYRDLAPMDRFFNPDNVKFPGFALQLDFLENISLEQIQTKFFKSLYNSCTTLQLTQGVFKKLIKHPRFSTGSTKHIHSNR